ncbi:hypothetical protein V1289_000440 [Bradyrhizobium sp. AZCC 2289]
MESGGPCDIFGSTLTRRFGPSPATRKMAATIDVRYGVIVDVEASRAIRQAEVGAARTMIDRKERFGLKPERLAADTAYGPASMPNWLVEEKSIAPQFRSAFVVHADRNHLTSQALQAKGCRARRNHGRGLGHLCQSRLRCGQTRRHRAQGRRRQRLDLPLFLFRAVVRSAVVPNMETVRSAAEAFDGPMDELVPRLLSRAAAVLSRPTIIRVARMVIGES